MASETIDSTVGLPEHREPEGVRTLDRLAPLASCSAAELQARDLCNKNLLNISRVIVSKEFSYFSKKRNS